MCGIYGVMNISHAGKEIYKGLKELEYRGYDSWGIAVSDDKKILQEKHVGKLKENGEHLPESNWGIGHTRWATHGGVTIENAHPHMDCTQSFTLVHNGIVENADRMQSLLKKQHHFVSQTDTEVIVHALEEALEKDVLIKALRSVFLSLMGMNACVVMSAKTHEIIAVKNGSPLVLGKKDAAWILSSDLPSLLGHIDTVHVLEDGEMVVLSQTGACLYDVCTGKKKQLRMYAALAKSEVCGLGEYHHYFEKEFHEASSVLQMIAKRKDKDFAGVSEEIQKTGGVVLLGCGTASYAGKYGEYVLATIAHIPSMSLQANESEHMLTAWPKAVALCISQSGETADLLHVVHKMKIQRIKTIAFVNVGMSSLDRQCDTSVLLNSGREVSVTSSKAFVVMTGMLFLLAHRIIGKQNMARKMLEVASRQMDIIASDKYLTYIHPVAKLLSKQEHVFVLGKGMYYPLALECALKLKEIGYLHAEGFASQELKHGMLALIQKGSVCIVFAPDDETYMECISSAMEVKARGGYIIGITSRKHAAFDIVLPVKECKEATFFVMVTVVHVLSYQVALVTNDDIDKPRNLAKSVTVK